MLNITRRNASRLFTLPGCYIQRVPRQGAPACCSAFQL